MSKMKKRNKLILNVILILIASVIIFSILFGSNFNQILESLVNIDKTLLVLALVLVFFWQFIIGAILTKLTKYLHKNYKYYQGFINSLIASFFHGITPSASGGQVIQTYIFNKQGVETSKSLSILWIDFIIYQASLCIFTFILIVLRYNYFFNTYNNWFGLVIISFLINLSIILGLFAVAKFDKFHIWVSDNGINFLHRIKIIKNPEKTRANFQEKINQFQIESKKISGNFKLIFVCVFLNFLRLVVYDAIAIVIFMALKIPFDLDLIITSIAISAFVSMLSNFIPLPGGSGGAEGLFLLMYSQLFVATKVQTALIVWRFITYYALMIVGGLVFLFNNIKEGLE